MQNCKSLFIDNDKGEKIEHCKCCYEKFLLKMKVLDLDKHINGESFLSCCACRTRLMKEGKMIDISTDRFYKEKDEDSEGISNEGINTVKMDNNYVI